MRFAYFPGCKIPHHLPQYGQSVRAVCAELDVELVDLEFNCCGWPVRHEDLLASAFSAARNLSLAFRAGLPIMTPCKCCFGNLKHAQSWMRGNRELRDAVNGLLKKEGLPFPGEVGVVHLLTVLDRAASDGILGQRCVRPLTDLKVACHYGCHALRPGHVTGFDDPLAPTIFERTVSALGAEPVNWDLRLECCGYPLRGADDKISEALMRRKLEDARHAGADVVATACTYCQLQFQTERDKLPREDPLHKMPRAVLISHLAGRALGLNADELGVDGNFFESEGIGF